MSQDEKLSEFVSQVLSHFPDDNPRLQEYVARYKEIRARRQQVVEVLLESARDYVVECEMYLGKLERCRDAVEQRRTTWKKFTIDVWRFKRNIQNILNKRRHHKARKFLVSFHKFRRNNSDSRPSNDEIDQWIQKFRDVLSS